MRRKARRSLGSRLRPYWMIFIVLAGAAAYGGYRLVEWPGFALLHVDVVGTHATPVSDVVRSADLRVHGNIWLQNFSGARARVEQLPYVLAARLHRRLPDTVVIEVTERRPTACLVDSSGAAALLDHDGRVLRSGCGNVPVPRYRTRGVPVPEAGAFMTDAGVVRLRRDADALSSDGHHYVAFAHDRFGDLEATLPNGIIVQFGAEGDIQEKARLVDPILKQLGARSATVSAIDLRAPNTPVVRYR